MAACGWGCRDLVSKVQQGSASCSARFGACDVLNAADFGGNRPLASDRLYPPIERAGIDAGMAGYCRTGIFWRAAVAGWGAVTPLCHPGLDPGSIRPVGIGRRKASWTPGRVRGDDDKECLKPIAYGRAMSAAFGGPRGRAQITSGPSDLHPDAPKQLHIARAALNRRPSTEESQKRG